jgi:hypothetical protein
MDISAVMDDLGAACATITDLRSFEYYSDKITPPAAIVQWPAEYDFDQTMSRGSDNLQFPIVVLVGRADARTSRDRLAKYVAGSGSSTVKGAIESFEATSYDTARVTKVEFGMVTMAAVSYLAATFTVDIYGPGED